ncbi:MAG TPA: DUF1326 domain-containing protein [Myxococcota bacterium]|nr:DUF1326 domain-containing protein [Myxococcota bacterium]
MAFVEWKIQGVEYGNCNCNLGCPCQFNALPSHGNCRAHSFFRIERGHFADVKLDGLAFGFLAAWPGPIHMGDGTYLLVVDERADAKQRAALEAIALGRETEPGTLITQVFSGTISRVLPMMVKPIELSIDVERVSAKLRVPGLIEAEAHPIKNPVTGAAHRVRVQLPLGMEFTEAEFAAGNCRSQGPIELTFDETHAHIARIHWSTHGVVH